MLIACLLLHSINKSHKRLHTEEVQLHFSAVFFVLRHLARLQVTEVKMAQLEIFIVWLFGKQEFLLQEKQSKITPKTTIKYEKLQRL